jgi:hypothetical protein
MTRRPLPHRRWLILAGLAAGTLAPARASAQSADDSARAERLFTEAMGLIDKGQFSDACPRLEESQRLDPALGTEFNLAVCDEKIGKLAAAFRHQTAVLKLAHATGKKGREDAAREHLEALTPHVAHLVLATPQSDVVVKVDGEIVDRDGFAFIPVESGGHAILATAPSMQPWSSDVTVPPSDPAAAGPEIRVDIPVLRPLEARTITVEKETTNTKRVAAWIAGGLGVAGLGTAIVTGVMILSAKSTAQGDCTPQCRDQSGRDAVNTGNSLLPINSVAWGVTAVGLGAGATLFYLSLKKTPAATAAIGPTFGPDGGGVTLRGAF